MFQPARKVRFDISVPQVLEPHVLDLARRLQHLKFKKYVFALHQFEDSFDYMASDHYERESTLRRAVGNSNYEEMETAFGIEESNEFEEWHVEDYWQSFWRHGPPP